MAGWPYFGFPAPLVEPAVRSATVLAEDGTATGMPQRAGIRPADRPGPLYQLLVLATPLSARISADIAVAAIRFVTWTRGDRA
jgi:hypothetical protein